MRKPWLWKIHSPRPQFSGARVTPVPPGLIRLFIFTRRQAWGQSVWLRGYFSQKTCLCWTRGLGLEIAGETSWSRHNFEQWVLSMSSNDILPVNRPHYKNVSMEDWALEPLGNCKEHKLHEGRDSLLFTPSVNSHPVPTTEAVTE